MSKFTKFQPVVVADSHSAAFESATYLGLSGEDNYPYTVLLECNGAFEVENYMLCARVVKGLPVMEDVDREYLLERRRDLKEQEEYLVTTVKREQSNLSSVLSSLDGIEKQLTDLASNN